MYGKDVYKKKGGQTYGGECKCPSGKKYWVGSRNWCRNDRHNLACYNQESEGKCNKSSKSKWRNKRVDCSLPSKDTCHSPSTTQSWYYYLTCTCPTTKKKYSIRGHYHSSYKCTYIRCFGGNIGKCNRKQNWGPEGLSYGDIWCYRKSDKKLQSKVLTK